MIKKLGELQLEINLAFDQKLQFTYPYSSIKDVQATREAFSPQKHKHETLTSLTVSGFVALLDLEPDSDPLT
jgi:hypothetical protein